MKQSYKIHETIYLNPGPYHESFITVSNFIMFDKMNELEQNVSGKDDKVKKNHEYLSFLCNFSKCSIKSL